MSGTANEGGGRGEEPRGAPGVTGTRSRILCLSMQRSNSTKTSKGCFALLLGCLQNAGGGERIVTWREGDAKPWTGKPTSFGKEAVARDEWPSFLRVNECERRSGASKRKRAIG